jgi:molybdopterin-containing oxidoreductase family iron-sulfur binding subunit
LDFLYTRPRLTYMARVRNPNPSMPDYQETPLSTQLFEQNMGHHPTEHGAAHAGAGAAGHGEAKGHH